MNHLDTSLTNLDLVGVKLYVNEAKKFIFQVHFKKYFVKSEKDIWNKSVTTADSCPSATVTLIQLNQLTESQPESAVKFCF